ncbi:MAG: ExeA family protein [Candidatus Anammoxibacter sp.]
MYYEYWSISKPPFDNVPDPSMYAECHSSMETAIAETLFAIEEGEECISVIVGDVGLGKTLSIRMVIDSLEQEKYKMALVTNPSLTFVQLMKEIIGQLTGKQCEEKKKVDLLETFNKLLFETYDEGKKVLIFIDEANVISQKNLESIRLLTNMQDDNRNLFTIVLAGQIELAKRLESPKFANLFQRIGTYCKLEKIESKELIKTYVETRLRLAGCTKTIFNDSAINRIWEHSEEGVPRLINKLCKLSLKAGETNELDIINGKIIDQIGARFQRTTIFAEPKRAPRKMPLEEMTPSLISETILEQDNVSASQTNLESENLLAEENTAIFSQDSGDNEDKKLATSNLASESPTVPTTEHDPTIDNEFFELEIGEHKVKVDFSHSVISNTQSLNDEKRMKLAGSIAANTLKQNPELTNSFYSDPVTIWGEIRDFVLDKMGAVSAVAH